MEPGIEASTYQSVRPYLFSVAYRMTGSAADAEDLVQDAWIRYLAAGSPAVTSLRAYLTTTVSRLALDHLKSARVQRERYTGTWMPEPILTDHAASPAETAELHDSVSFALLLVMESLSPLQRIIYVLRESFGLSFDEIAGHVGKTAAACRQAYRRARTTLDASEDHSAPPTEEQRPILERTMAALERGDVDALMACLAEDVTWNGDGGPRRLSLQRQVVGRDRVARGMAGLTQKLSTWATPRTRIIEVNGGLAVMTIIGNWLDGVNLITLDENGLIATVRGQRNPDKLRHLARSLNLVVVEFDDREFVHQRARGASARLVE